ncbi:hypothetical protein GQ600_1259 [Phytophthora cactorum]|nr:hypothetical protein GQ600_1259 [Phytophthora cactorum]
MKPELHSRNGRRSFARPSVRSHQRREATSKSLGDPGGRPVQGSASSDTQEARALAHGDATFNKRSDVWTPRTRVHKAVAAGRASKMFGRRQTNTGASSSDDDDLLRPTYEDEDPQAELTRQMREIAALNDSDPTED